MSAFMIRAKFGLYLMRVALMILPPSRYKSELNAALWTIYLNVQAHCAALDVAEKDKNA